MRGLTGKRIVVCGGATGIGAATAERLAATRGPRPGRPVDPVLLSDDAEWINGQTWSIDGGGSLRD